MYLSKKEAWRGLIYRLLYPALLGSMLYDIFSPPTVKSWEYVGQVILVCIYLVDYLYLYNDWMSPGYPNRWFEIFCDGFIAILYRFSFGSIHTTHPTRASLFLGLIFFLYLFYEVGRHPTTRKFILATVTVVLLNLPLSLLFDDNRPKAIFFAATALTTLSLLAFFVFYYGPKYIFPAQQLDENEPLPIGQSVTSKELDAGLENSDDRISQQTIYQENARVAAVFWEWRHKVLVQFFAGIPALIVLTGWLYQTRGFRLWLCGPLILGATFAYTAYKLDERNRLILEKTYEVGSRIEKKVSEEGAIYKFINDSHHSGLTYTRVLHAVYRLTAIALLVASVIILVLWYWEKS